MSSNEDAVGRSAIISEVRNHPGRGPRHILNLLAPVDLRLQAVVDHGHPNSLRGIEPADIPIDIFAADPKALIAGVQPASVNKNQNWPIVPFRQKEVETMFGMFRALDIRDI